jgi:hypothetical protein
VASASSPQLHSWVIQPLIDAGLAREEVCSLVFQLAFQDIVTEGRGTPTALSELVADHPVAVRAAWVQTISRLITADLS